MAGLHVPSGLPLYRCHKVVRAAQIASITEDHSVAYRPFRIAFITPEGSREIRDRRVSMEWHRKHSPQLGGYFVEYADGYESYSPREAFEEGYSMIGEE